MRVQHSEDDHGPATNIEKWDISVAIGMASEGIHSSYNQALVAVALVLLTEK
ncbi:hypothetical protein [Photobacterium salinisoli]|uniref:hypothetical protein n=1 Tax=Photobacterium salinisoli TaxID=1616783 RepID=UPI0013C523A1|nr:hypothetical protein [Photobacterium salinisoli]